MKVKTIFPIIIQGNQTRASVGAPAKSNRKKRLHRKRGVKVVHFDGDNALSFNGCGEYEPQDEWNFSFDGKKANSSQIADFQKFANSNGFTPQLTVDGKYGTNTQKAIDAFGTKYDAYVKFRDDDSGGTVINNPPVPASDPKVAKATEAAKVEAAKSADKKSLKDKIKGLSVGAKIGIAVGGVAIIGLIIFVATRKKGN